jgi:hypothetical protein
MQLTRIVVFALVLLALKEGAEAKKTTSKKAGKKSKVAKGWTWTKGYEGRCEACRALIEAASIGVSPQSVAPFDKMMSEFKGDLRQQADQERLVNELTKLLPLLKLCETHVFQGTANDLQKACREMLKRPVVKRSLVGMLMNTMRLSAEAPTAGPFEHMLNSTALICSADLKFCMPNDWSGSERAEWFSFPTSDCETCKMVVQDFESQLHRFERKGGAGVSHAAETLLEKHCRTLPARHRVNKEHVEMCNDLIADHDFELIKAARLPTGPARKEEVLRICAKKCSEGGSREL